MEEEKAAAYYDELSRKGGGAARFKQGLGFSSIDSDPGPPSRGSALPSSSPSFMSNFVRASTIPTTTATATTATATTTSLKEEDKEIERKTQIEAIQNKLKKNKEPICVDVSENSRNSRVRNVKDDDRISRSRDRHGRRRRDEDRESDKDMILKRRSGSGSDEEDRDSSRRRHHHRSPSKHTSTRKDSRSSTSRRNRSRSRSRSLSPTRRRDRRRSDGEDARHPHPRRSHGRVLNNHAPDYANLIHGFHNMTPAERVKAKMKLQLSQTAEKDTKMGSGLQWERFDFNKDAPVDDSEIEAADDDAALVKQIGKTFRFTSLEGKRDDEIKNAHEEAMFGVPAPNPSYTSDSEDERTSEKEKKETNDDDLSSSLMNEKVLSKQQGSWRDRARRKVG